MQLWTRYFFPQCLCFLICPIIPTPQNCENQNAVGTMPGTQQALLKVGAIFVIFTGLGFAIGAHGNPLGNAPWDGVPCCRRQPLLQKLAQ